MCRLSCTDSVKLCTEYLKTLKSIHRFAVTFNTKNYPLFLFEDILQKSEKNGKKCIKVIQYIIFEDLLIDIGNKNSPTLFFDILNYTTIIYEDICTGLEDIYTGRTVEYYTTYSFS